jgi:hypothetical protein
MQPFYHEGQVEVDGETLHLVCNFRAIDCIEALTGLDMSSVLADLQGAPTHGLVGKVLWGLLREKHEGTTLDMAAGAAFGPDGPKVGLAMGDIFRRAFNIGEEAKGANPPKRRGRSKTI